MEFTATGVQVRTFDEIYTDLSNKFKLVYGDNINLDQDTPDGQLLGIIVKEVLDLETFGLNMYNSMSIISATGVSLDRLAKYTGFSRSPASYSTADLTITTDRTLTLPVNWLIKDTNSQNWLTTQVYNLSLGVNTISVRAENIGMIEAPINTINEPINIVLGVLTATNPAVAPIGKDEESDGELRARIQKSTEIQALSTIGSIQAKIGAISGVSEVKVYENDTNVVVNTIPPHSIWVIVEGGTIADIGTSIAINKTAGAGTKGAINYTYNETIGGQLITHNINFDRASVVNIFVKLNVSRRVPTIPIDIVAIENNLKNKLYKIGENSVASELYSEIYSAGVTFIATDLQISIDDVTYIDTRLIANLDTKFKINTVVVNEI